MNVPRLLMALALGSLGGWIGSNVVYRNHNMFNKHDPLHRTMQERTPDNEWKWWVGLCTGGFVGMTLPYLRKPDRP